MSTERPQKAEKDISVTLTGYQTRMIPRTGRTFQCVSVTTDGQVQIGLSQSAQSGRYVRASMGAALRAGEDDFTYIELYNDGASTQTVVLQTSDGTIIDNRSVIAALTVAGGYLTAKPEPPLANTAAVVAVGAAAVKIHTGTANAGRVSIQNVGGASFTTIYLGYTNGVTTASYGAMLTAAVDATHPGGSFEWPGSMDLYAIGSGANGAVAVMSTTVAP